MSGRRGHRRGRCFCNDTETQTQEQVTDDPEVKTYPYGWVAPEYDELVFLVLLGDTQLGIYRDTGGPYWERITTIEVPPASTFDYIGSPETFVANNTSYITFVTKIIPTGSSYVDAEVWVTDIEPDPQQRFMLRCDNGVPETRRTDPESYLGAEQVFVVYNELNAEGEFEIWRYATGIPSTHTDPGEDPPGEEPPVPALQDNFHYPNPAGEFVYLNQEEGNIDPVEIFSLSGQLLRSQAFTPHIYVGDLPPGVYVVVTRSGNDRYRFKLVKE